MAVARFAGDKLVGTEAERSVEVALAGATFFATDSLKVYHRVGTTWEQIDVDKALSSLTDVILTGIANGQVLFYENGDWVNRAITESDISDLQNYLTSVALNDITDVTIGGTPLADEHVLAYNSVSGQWENVPLTSLTSDVQVLDDLNDVVITSGDTGDFLRHNGTNWVDSAIQNGDITQVMVTQHEAALSITESQITDLQAYLLNITGEPIGDLSDVNITTPSDGHALFYDTGNWVNRTITEADISDLGAYLETVNLADTYTATQVTVTNTAGTNAVLDGATQSFAGVMTATDKTKLDGIATGAEVNQNTFSNVAVSGQTTVAADTKTDTMTFVAGTNIDITTDAGADSITFNTGSSVNNLVNNITVTQAVDLDAIETRVNELDASIVLMGTWDASIETTFPSATYAGESWIISASGTIDGVEFTANDRIVAIVAGASTTTFAGNWHKLDYTDQVLSVNSQTGAVVLDTDDINEGTSNLYYTNARANAAIDARVTKTFVDALNVDADTLDGQHGAYYLDWNNFTNVPTYDNYVNWQLQAEGGVTEAITSGEAVNFTGSGATTVTRTGSTINISSTDNVTDPAGANTQVQYNNSGSFGASANFTFDSGLLGLTGKVELSEGGPALTALASGKATQYITTGVENTQNYTRLMARVGDQDFIIATHIE